MDILKDLSKILKSYREENHLSQYVCAQRLGIAKSTLQKLENCESVSSQTIQHVASKLGMELLLRPRPQQCDSTTAAALIGEFLAELRSCDLPDSKRRGVETALKGIEILLAEN